MRPRIDPPEAAERLRWASRHGFTTHILGAVDGPCALVLARFWPGFVDIAHIRGADRTEVARIPRDERANIWRPVRVTFHNCATVLDALKALQCLPPPGAGGAPREPYRPPRGGAPEPLTVTDAERAKVTTRPPSRVQGHERAARRVADHLGIGEVRARVRPDEKAAVGRRQAGRGAPASTPTGHPTASVGQR
ncbi:MAG: hypothetical protein ACRDQB_08740 [Thermocrispum sp.]